MEIPKELYLRRYSDNGESTLSTMFWGMEFLNHSIEDGFNAVKIKGRTRIPAGRYKLVIRKILSPKTKNYRKKYPWFEYHIQLLDVPGYNYIYMHIGNSSRDTKGCILTADLQNNNQIGHGFAGASTAAFKRFYKRFYPLLKEGKEIYINVIDEIEV